MRRWLGIAVGINSDAFHGHMHLSDNSGARLNARRAVTKAAWRQVFVEAGGQVLVWNVERLRRSANVPGDRKRLDLIVRDLNVQSGQPYLRFRRTQG